VIRAAAFFDANPTGGASETSAAATAGVSAAYRACRSKSKLSQRMNRDDA
jgi:hypothetical protein